MSTDDRRFDGVKANFDRLHSVLGFGDRKPSISYDRLTVGQYGNLLYDEIKGLPEGHKVTCTNPEIALLINVILKKNGINSNIMKVTNESSMDPFIVNVYEDLGNWYVAGAVIQGGEGKEMCGGGLGLLCVMSNTILRVSGKSSFIPEFRYPIKEIFLNTSRIVLFNSQSLDDCPMSTFLEGGRDEDRMSQSSCELLKVLNVKQII